MVLNSIITPQIAYALSGALNEDDSDKTSQVEAGQDETPDIDVKENDGEDDDVDGRSDSAEVQDVNADKGVGDSDDNPAPEAGDEVADETPEDINNNGPPLEREEVNSEKEHTDEVDSAEEATYEKEAKDDAPEPQIVLNQAQYLGNIFDFDYFQLDGESVEDPHEINFDGTYQIQYHWETDANIQPGDTASLKLPDVFLEWADAPTQNITVGPENIVVGTYTINNGVLEFVFDEGIAGESVQEIGRASCREECRSRW